eukprot:CAMPEP_0198511762 /NCGR_PEP_ID=MMETSP1462-20131121/15012_1 /TAXON_ID=1333877 /ORGANISM="Brandtodinium nutriculum, Strain RCC3387" /LENGTH=125 /DNA_ID=CAMNT_0044241145 /DNA_START=158 /DNA_END=535 /DNA_ORIENTATION=-
MTRLSDCEYTSAITKSLLSDFTSTDTIIINIADSNMYRMRLILPMHRKACSGSAEQQQPQQQNPTQPALQQRSLHPMSDLRWMLASASILMDMRANTMLNSAWLCALLKSRKPSILAPLRIITHA